MRRRALGALLCAGIAMGRVTHAQANSPGATGGSAQHAKGDAAGSAAPLTQNQSVNQATNQTTEQAITQGQAALRAGHPGEALASFKEALAQDPENAAANLLASSAEIALLQPADAVRYGERAQALEPGNWKVHTTLVTAYAMAGDAAHRDAERALLRQDHSNPALADARETTGFLLDLFQAGRYRVEAVEYFRPLGKYNTYYRFIIRNKTGARVWTIEVNSDSLNQTSWAQSYPKQAAEGQRQFQIESAEGPNHVSYRTFSGAASYDYARAVVAKLLLAQEAPFPGEAAPTE